MTIETAKRYPTQKIGTFIGGIIGLALFLIVGLLPSLLYGGYAGVIMGSAIFGSPIHENILAQATVVLGILAGVLSIGGIFTIAGAVIGTGVYSLVSMNRVAKVSQDFDEALVPEPIKNRETTESGKEEQSLSHIQGEALAEGLN